MAGKNYIGAAIQKMKAKGTVGAFGPATPKKIAAGKAAGGVQAKRAQFAQNMERIATKRTASRVSRRGGR